MNLKSPQRRSSRGFTLVELLVVIGIIALLVGILMPVLSKARAQANRVACLSNIKQLYNGILMYCNENKGWFPTCAAGDDGLTYMQYPDDWIHWEANRNLDNSAIAKYVGRDEKLKDLLRCPADSFEGRATYPGLLPGQGPYLYSYSMNYVMGRNIRPYGPFGRSKIHWWRVPSKKIAMTESSEKYCLTPATAYAIPLTQRHGRGVFHGDVPGNPPLVRGVMTGTNVSTVFMDGHAEGIDQDFAFNASLFVPADR